MAGQECAGIVECSLHEESLRNLHLFISFSSFVSSFDGSGSGKGRGEILDLTKNEETVRNSSFIIFSSLHFLLFLHFHRFII